MKNEERPIDSVAIDTIKTIKNGLKHVECKDIGKRIHNFKDLTNRVFSRLKVIGFVGVDIRKKAFWLCECECGNRKVLKGRNLINGSTKSCGCLKEREEIIGHKFGKLLVLDFSHTKGCNIYYNCLCDCGLMLVTIRSSLIRGRTTSCGCHRRKEMSTHHMSYSPEYGTWSGMIQRCNNPNSAAYEDYGGRGIKVCKRWYKFENFYKDMGKRPDGLTLERVNVNGNYEPKNCKWASFKEQGRNRRNTNFITYNNKTMILKDWAKEYNINYNMLCSRYYFQKWNFHDCLTIPVKKAKLFEYNGEQKTLQELSKISVVSENCFRCRIRNGWDIKRAIETPLRNKRE